MNLFEAARLGDAEQVRALLARKARPGAILREAAMLGENLLAIRNYTPLMIAAAGGHVEVVRLLLDAGAEPDRQDYCTATRPCTWQPSSSTRTS